MATVLVTLPCVCTLVPSLHSVLRGGIAGPCRAPSHELVLSACAPSPFLIALEFGQVTGRDPDSVPDLVCASLVTFAVVCSSWWLEPGTSAGEPPHPASVPRPQEGEGCGSSGWE